MEIQLGVVGVMSGTAVGAYFRTLRERKGVSQEALGRLLDVSGKQIYNWERGNHKPGSEALVGLMGILGGSVEHLRQLFRDGATEQQGEELAYKWLSKEDIAELDQMSNEQLIEWLAILDELQRQDTVPTAIRLLRALVGR